MDWRMQIEKINEDFRELSVTWMSIPSRVLDVLTEGNADEVITSLSGSARESFLEWARELSLSEDDDMLSFDAVDGKPSDEKKKKFRIVRDWARTHPMPERAEPFPFDLVNGLLSRVDDENRRLLPLIQKNRRHPERVRFQHAASVAADLENALQVAKKDPTNPQAQAFAWDLLDRALRSVDGIIEVTQAEQRLIDVQKRT